MSAGEVRRLIVIECGIGFEDFKCGDTTCAAEDDRTRFARMPSRGWTVRSVKRAIAADMEAANTSYVERLNATTRQHMRRLTRLTHAFSKKLENFEAAVALHFAYYNLVKRHITIRCAPAMAAEVVSSPWTVRQLVEVATA